jgi:hypothetical protein
MKLVVSYEAIKQLQSLSLADWCDTVEQTIFKKIPSLHRNFGYSLRLSRRKYDLRDAIAEGGGGSIMTTRLPHVPSHLQQLEE